MPGGGAEESGLGGAECYAAAEDQPVIFDDEPRTPSELARHPEKEAILVSAGKEIDQLIEQQIGVEVTPAEVRQVTEKGLRILQCKMVYKRKYHIGEEKSWFCGRAFWRGKRLVCDGPYHSKEPCRICYLQQSRFSFLAFKATSNSDAQFS